MRRYLERLYHVFVSCAFKFLGCFPKKDVYFFESFHGKQYSDNPRAIYEFLRDNYSDKTCIWAVKKGFEAPFIDENVPFVRRLGLRWLLAMPRAKFWVFNTRMPKWMVKSRGTLYIQTWHGTPLKKIGLDIEEVRMPGNDTALYQKEFIDETSRWDYLISPNTYSSNIFKQAFAYDGTIIEKGYPRNDILLKKSSTTFTSYIRQYLGIAKEKKVLLYAPTWRDDEYFNRGKYKFINHFPFSDILASDEDILILVRLHYLVSDSIDISSFNQRVIDVSGYQDISHLYLISDVLITDYSSVMFDFAMTKKPMLFYMYDKEKYENEIRGFYFDAEKFLPGEIITESNSLITGIHNALYGEDNMCLYERFCDLFCMMESHSSQLIVEEVLGD